MNKAALIVGARPQFIKIAPLALKLRRYYNTVLIHTGQHYDFMMSDTFFEELNIFYPDYHLNIPGGSSGKQTGRMIESLDSVLNFEKPDFAIVVGDTNSTLAGALAAAKLRIPIIHVEAGVRSKDKNLPEQINRVATDSVADCFFCPTPSSVANLNKEGKYENVFDTGDIVYDCLRMFENKIPANPSPGFAFPDNYVLATMHRAEAVDNRENLSDILRSISTTPRAVIMPVHPRTRKMIARFDLEKSLPGNLTIIDPVSYLSLLSLLKSCEFVISDSGGIQREAIFFGKRVIVPRPETEWLELEESGWLTIAGYTFDLGRLVSEPPMNLDAELMRPASETMIENMRKLY